MRENGHPSDVLKAEAPKFENEGGKTPEAAQAERIC
jgi:hypothetical protein